MRYLSGFELLPTLLVFGLTLLILGPREARGQQCLASGQCPAQERVHEADEVHLAQTGGSSSGEPAVGSVAAAASWRTPGCKQ